MNQPTKNPLAPTTAFAYGQERALSQEEKFVALSHFIFAPLGDFARLADAAIEASPEALLIAVEFAGQPYAINLRRYDALHASLKDQLTALAQDLARYPSASDLHTLLRDFADHQQENLAELRELWAETAKLWQASNALEINQATMAQEVEKSKDETAKLWQASNALETAIEKIAGDLQALQQTVADHYADLDEKIRIARKIEESSTLEVYELLGNLAQLGVENQERISALEAQLAQP